MFWRKKKKGLDENIDKIIKDYIEKRNSESLSLLKDASKKILDLENKKGNIFIYEIPRVLEVNIYRVWIRNVEELEAGNVEMVRENYFLHTKMLKTGSRYFEIEETKEGYMASVKFRATSEEEINELTFLLEPEKAYIIGLWPERSILLINAKAEEYKDTIVIDEIEIEVKNLYILYLYSLGRTIFPILAKF